MHRPCECYSSFASENNRLAQWRCKAAWEALERLYKLVTKDKEHKFINDFNNNKLSSINKNPDEWFTESAVIRLQLQANYKHKIDDDAMVAHIIYNILPPEYEGIIDILKSELEKTPSPTLEDVNEWIQEKFSMIMSRKENETIKKSENEEQALINKGQFKGTCWICGKKGHKATDCWENKKNESKHPSWYKVGE